VSDGVEVSAAYPGPLGPTTNPLLADTDGDGVRDGDEDTNQNGVLDEGEGDPTDPGAAAAAPVLDDLIIGGSALYTGCHAPQREANGALLWFAGLALVAGLRRPLRRR
jgi:hypothetical protein